MNSNLLFLWVQTIYSSWRTQTFQCLMSKITLFFLILLELLMVSYDLCVWCVYTTFCEALVSTDPILFDLELFQF